MGKTAGEGNEDQIKLFSVEVQSNFSDLMLARAQHIDTDPSINHMKDENSEKIKQVSAMVSHCIGRKWIGCRDNRNRV